MQRYNPNEIEPKWQKIWQDQKLYRADNDSDKQPYYALSFFPYPSGTGLHIGHTRNFTITDVVARYKKLQGYEVLHPMGWDSFGLPAENYAIKTGTPPQITTKQNTDNFRAQCKKLGLSIDWDREFASTDPEYYRWTQWFFLLLYERNLAYQQESMQFWCDICKTTLANEQVVNGCCWRHEDTPVTKKSLPQWFFKITEYADRLAEDLDTVDWPDGIKAMQRNWIGRSKGAEIDFAIDGYDSNIRVFTTRPDTLFGATYMVLAPEHPLVKEITTQEQKDLVEKYVAETETKTDIDRMDESREKTGVFTGTYAINPVNEEKIPVWIADYVLYGYGTGAIMAVPAHDQRDYDFAQKFDLPIRQVVKTEDDTADRAAAGEGTMINSGEYDGLESSATREKIVADLTEKEAAEEKINYRIRDWLISRQRYWGAPIPVIHCEKCGTVPVPKDQLPVVLPEITDFEPANDGLSPLERVNEWVNVECPDCAGPARRETDTMDGFACSSWYFLRFADPRNDKAPFEKDLAERWLPVDMYVGGAEHAVMHLLYARMWTKVMQDAGLIDFGEPFAALRNQGMLLAEDGEKISKSKGNDIRPDEIIDSGYGADALRMIVLFLAPYNQSTPWSNEGLGGVYRFLQRSWTVTQEFLENSRDTDDEVSDELIRAAHKAIKKVTEDLHELGFNTAIAALMEYVNELYKIKAADGFSDKSWKWALEVLAQLMAPFAPHISEELWQQLGHAESVHLSEWPKWDDRYLVADKMTVAVQVNGKLRGEVSVSSDAAEEDVIAVAKSDDKVAAHLNGKEIRKTIYIPQKIVNFVV